VKRLFLIVIAILTLCSAAFAASGDKTPASKLKFHIISSSTRRACTLGEQRIDKIYLYTCYSTGTGKWKRVSHGATF